MEESLNTKYINNNKFFNKISDIEFFKDLYLKDIFIFQIITFWNVWYWFFFRIIDKSDEPLGLLSLITFVFFIGKTNLNIKISKNNLRVIVSLLIFYILIYKYSSDMIHAILALISITYTLYISKTKISPAIFGLSFLSLPIIASMQFYLGYPLRMVSGYFMIILLRMNGLYVIQEGTCLSLNKKIICIDAPCSGVNMLWFSFYFTSFICCLYKLNFKKTLIVSIISFISIIISNIMRSTSLFYLESKIINLPSFSHQGIGIITFILSIFLVIMYVNISEKKCKI